MLRETERERGDVCKEMGKKVVWDGDSERIKNQIIQKGYAKFLMCVHEGKRKKEKSFTENRELRKRERERVELLEGVAEDNDNYQ